MTRLKELTAILSIALLFAACAKQEQTQTTTDTTTRGSAAVADTAKRGITEGQGKGIVRAMDSVTKSVTLDHNDIPNVMDAMTMEYHVEKTEVLRGVHVGDSVSFTLQDRGEGNYVVTQIAPIPKQ